MSPGLLQWRMLNTSRDPDIRAALDTFECTTRPGKPSLATGWRRPHLKFWEYEVESYIRGFRPPVQAWRRILGGFDGHGLAAIAAWDEVDGPARVTIVAGAVSLRLRGKGGGYADELGGRAIEEMIEAAQGVGAADVEIVGYVYEENGPSQALCRRLGLRHTGMGGEGVQEWTTSLPVPPPLDAEQPDDAPADPGG